MVGRQSAAQRADPVEGTRSDRARRDLQQPRRFGHRLVAVIDFSQHLALGTRQSDEGGADADFVDAGVGGLAAGVPVVPLAPEVPA